MIEFRCTNLANMCGVFGVIRPSGIEPRDQSFFDAISSHLKHRGPDGDGYILESNALLGMHRLSIIDVEHGWQPFWSQDGSIGVLGNGEIYNAAQLRAELLQRGVIFKTHSDIEVVAHLYQEEGLACVQQLRGMFALVVVDKRSSEVVLIRDRLGEKPLSFTRQGSAIYFASEQTPLVRSGLVSLQLDDEVVAQYLLHGFVPEPRSIVKGIEKVPAAHALHISLLDGSSKLVRYWNALDFVSDRILTTSETSAAVTDAVEVACNSDVPIGIALSAGLDSSMIAAIASRQRPDLIAFSVSYSEGGVDESEAAAGFAAELGIDHHTITLQTYDIASQFAEVCGMRDEPVSDIAGPALAALPRAARAAGVPVLLTGVGGDELFWGYEWIRHLAAWTANYSAPEPKRSFKSHLRVTSPPSTVQGLASWAWGLGGLRTQRDLTTFMRRWRGESTVPLPLYEFQYGYRQITSQIRSLTKVSSEFPQPEFFGDTNPLTKAAEYTHASNETYLRVNSLLQVDRLSMHHSVEARTPFADSVLLETIMSGRLSSTDLFASTKATQRAVASELLPAHVLQRPKRGFTPPVRKWIRAIWNHNRSALNASVMSEVSSVRQYRAQRIIRSPLDHFGRVNQMSLRLMTLELWLRSQIEEATTF